MNKNRITRIAMVVMAAVLTLCCLPLLNQDTAAKAASDISISPDHFSLREGESKELTITLSGSLSSDKTYNVNLNTVYGTLSTTSITGMSSGGSAKVTYTAPTGDVKTDGDGDIDITAWIVDSAGEHAHAWCNIVRLRDTIIPQISPAYATIYVGDTQVFSLQDFPGSIKSVNITSGPGVVNVGTVGTTSFTIQGLIEGTAVIKVETNTGATAECSVIVRKIPIKISSGDVYMKKNSTKFYSIKATTNIEDYPVPALTFTYTAMATAIAGPDDGMGGIAPTKDTADTLLIRSAGLSGTAPIRVQLSSGLTNKYYLVNDPVYINVHVQDTDEPEIHLSFSPDTTTLGKGDYTYMTIHVDAPQSQYVKITRSNLRTYLKDYNYSHPSTYVYWAQLDASDNATVRILPQYSGTCKITVSAEGAKDASRTFTVTGYPTMPQTGPDYTPVVIVAGLAMLAFCAATVLKIKRKQAE